MKVYGLFYEDIDETLVCLFQNPPTIEDLRKTITKEFFKPDDKYLTEILEDKRSYDYSVRAVDVIPN
jgi:hypothetical protein